MVSLQISVSVSCSIATRPLEQRVRKKSAFLDEPLTGVPKVDVVPVVGVPQLVGHDTQGHDLLSDEGVRPGDVHIHLRVVHLVGETLFHHLREIPGHSETAETSAHQLTLALITWCVTF